MSALPLGAGVCRRDDRRWTDLGCVVARVGRGMSRIRFESGETAELHTSDLRYLACRFEIALAWRTARASQGLRP
jgi:hypothetical protein